MPHHCMGTASLTQLLVSRTQQVRQVLFKGNLTLHSSTQLSNLRTLDSLTSSRLTEIVDSLRYREGEEHVFLSANRLGS